MSDNILPVLPAPPIPADVDLRDFPFTPLFRARLFGSTFHARATDSEWRAGVTLWLKSWDQVPAGSLPDDEIALCRLAELGRDIRSWRKVKERALHGWVKCSDGRLYHAVVAESVLEAWARRRSASSKGKAGASKRWGSGNATANVTAKEVDSTGIAQAMPGDSNRQGQGERQGKEEIPSLRSGISIAPKPEISEPQGFTEFYEVYPRKVGRRAAVKAYRSALNRAPPEAIFAGVRRYAAARKDQDPQFTKHPATWLNADGWLDEETQAHDTGNRGQERKPSAHENTLRGIALAAGLEPGRHEDDDHGDAQNVGESSAGSHGEVNAGGAARGTAPSHGSGDGAITRPAEPALLAAGHDAGADKAEIPGFLRRSPGRDGG